MSDRPRRVVLGVIASMVFALSTSAHADVPYWHDAKMKAENTAPIRAYAFDLRDVKLLDGPFRQAMEANRKYLLSIEPDRLLYNFRVTAGLPTTAKPYGGWDAPACEVRGAAAGHYLTACALLYRAIGDEQIKAKADDLVRGLAECQAKLKNGYLSGYPESFFNRLEAHQRVWAPWYNVHKIYAGLLDMYVLADNRQALEVCKRACDWVVWRIGRLTDVELQRVLGENEHGGMTDVLACLYGVTAEEKYLKAARRFNHQALLVPLMRREDCLTGLHGNTQIPKLIGAAREYELTGDRQLRTAAATFWESVARERSYANGGFTDHEFFSPKETLSQFVSDQTAETCVVYNIHKLTRHLFCWSPKAEYIDYYERGLFNQILASQHPQTAMSVYFLPLKSGCWKQFGTPFDSMWCCTLTCMERNCTYGNTIYFHDGKQTLWVNLFIASELSWRSRGVTVRQETRFPDEDKTRLTIACDEPTELTLQLRHPAWAVAGVKIKINGRSQPSRSSPGSYIALRRVWQDGDSMELTMPMKLRAEAFRDNPGRFALMYGPILLCTCTEAGNSLAVAVGEPPKIVKRLKPVDGQPLTFTGPAKLFRTDMAQPKPRDPIFIPFFREYGQPYVVYWDATALPQWRAAETEYQTELARQMDVERRSVDRIRFDPAANVDQKVQQEHGLRGDFAGHPWRGADHGGFFSLQMNVLPGQPQELNVTYWGSEPGGRVFDVQIDGQTIATQKLENNRPGRFFDVAYRIPPEMLRDKKTVRVRFQGHPGMIVGGIYGCHILKTMAARPEAGPAASGRAWTLTTLPAASKPAFGMKKILVVAERRLADNAELRQKFERYAEDIHAAFGAGVKLVSLESASPRYLKGLIRREMASGLAGVVLVGKVPKAYGEVFGARGSRDIFLCDLYFMNQNTLALPNGNWADPGWLDEGRPWNGIVKSESLRNIDFNWGLSSPDPSVVPVDRFSARYRGTLTPARSGVYTFTISSDNGRLLTVKGVRVIDAWVDDWGRDYAGTIRLEAGVPAPIVLDYFEDYGGAEVHLKWTPPGDKGPAIVPASAFSHLAVDYYNNMDLCDDGNPKGSRPFAGNGVFDRVTDGCGGARVNLMAPQIFVSRIETHTSSFLGDEVQLLKEFFDKDHAYWSGAMSLGNKAVLSFGSGSLAADPVVVGRVEQLFATKDIQVRVNPRSAEQYLKDLANPANLLSVYCGHGSEGGIGLGLGFWQLKNVAIQPLLVDLESCSPLRSIRVSPQHPDGEDLSGYIGGAHLFADRGKGHCLFVRGASKTSGGNQHEEFFYKALADGKPAGLAFIEWARQRMALQGEPGEWFDWFYPQVMIGDPLIVMKSPPH